LRLLHEVIIHEEAALAIPKVFLHLGFALLRALPPLFCVVLAAQDFTDLFQIRFGLVEQAVEADRGEVMCPGAVGPKRKEMS